MKNIKSFYSLASVCAASLLLWSCGKAGGEYQGREYMPDMAHSVAYEANYVTYYYNNTWGTEEEYRQMAEVRKPVEGTVARGYIPYKYENLEAFRESPEETYTQLQEKASAVALADATLVNPIKPTSKEELERVLVHGGELYNISCAVCHGKKGDGNGSIYDGGDGPYSAAPANYLEGDLLTAADARYYNAIMHGKGQMQPHVDKLNEEERWKVIHYIRSLQADKKGIDYFEELNISGADAKASLKDQFANIVGAAGSEEEGATDAAPSSITLDNVLYNTGSSDLKTSSYATLDELVIVLKAYPSINIEIGGHTDNVGKADKNLELSQKRAQSVASYLASHGIDGERVSYKGYGATVPVATNDTDAGKKQNRRTEVKIVK
jgi:outer membrane protein OmpA-like peptidoglycan-associated protein